MGFLLSSIPPRPNLDFGKISRPNNSVVKYRFAEFVKTVCTALLFEEFCKRLKNRFR